MTAGRKRQACVRNYAKITNGLFARIIGKISALTILQYVNFINNKPIGRIQYSVNSNVIV